ncbi:unnamed protein product [Notodromas monacha]|uniref:FACT complex subunit SSRP1 n=2 Tax=Notodromas monacha TaxID=399045 RepID=A0A7R9BZH1_9CRUS|nr:unnamed protein product [Notodromas monacha]CAG0923330.1 unnamed protein product [Notodromas monacha]
MSENLEFDDISQEFMGAMMPGKLKFTNNEIIFKQGKTGNVETIASDQIDLLNWQRLAGKWGLRVFTKDGVLHRFGPFREALREKLSKFFSNSFELPCEERDLCIKGWNWGTARFKGKVLTFDIAGNPAFELPLNQVSNCTTGKNEVIMEFHQSDVAPVSMMELRFHIPTSGDVVSGSEDAVEAFQEQVMSQASVISATGDAMASFKEIQCLTPRGRYEFKIYQKFVHLHGKTFDYKIPMTTVLRLFLLPHNDNRQIFFVMNLDPPIKQGMTRYPFLILLFNKEDETTLELPQSEKELESKFGGKLEKEMTGPTYEILSRLMRVLVGRKITSPGSFRGKNKSVCVPCTYKASAGYVYPLERSFLYIYKPQVIYVKFEEVLSVNFARSGGSTRSFDIEVEMKGGPLHTFSSIAKDEQGNLYDYISQKKLKIKSKGKGDDGPLDDDKGHAGHDAYLERVKAEAEEDDDDDGDEESEDEDFKLPAEEGSDVDLEYDSNASSTPSEDEDDDGAGGGGGGGSGDDSAKKSSKKKKKKEKEKKKESKPRKERTSKKKQKREDDGRPKRPPTAYFLWLNENREKIKSKNPGISVTELTKKAGEMWREMGPSDKKEHEAKQEELKKKYDAEMSEWKASGKAAAASAAAKATKSPTKEKQARKTESSPRKSATAASASGGSGSGFKSKEYIESDDSSSDDDSPKKGKKSKKSENEDSGSASSDSGGDSD